MAATPSLSHIFARPLFEKPQMVKGSLYINELGADEVEEMWDHVALVEYPSHEAFTAMLMSPEWAAIERHRVAGLAGQLNIRVESKAS